MPGEEHAAGLRVAGPRGPFPIRWHQRESMPIELGEREVWCLRNIAQDEAEARRGRAVPGSAAARVAAENMRRQAELMRRRY